MMSSASAYAHTTVDSSGTGDATQEGGLMEFQKCYSEETGGGMCLTAVQARVLAFLGCA